MNTYIDDGANAICLLGGTNNGLTYADLQTLIFKLSQIAPVCIYSGSDDLDILYWLQNHTDVSWIKMGSYKEQLGGLTNPSTNQRFFKKDYQIEQDRYGDVHSYAYLIDQTYLFQKEHAHE